MTTTQEAQNYTKKDFESSVDIRWCPGCGDYAILSAVQAVLPTLGIPKEKFVFVSGKLPQKLKWLTLKQGKLLLNSLKMKA